MEAGKVADSVATIVSREPDASGLLLYVGRSLSLSPPQDVAERIWGLLVRDIMPRTAKARQHLLESQYGQLPYGEFQLMRLVAETCNIADFCLADLRRASKDRWAHQIEQVDAFLAARKKYLDEYGAQLSSIRMLEMEEMQLAAHKAEIERQDVALNSQREVQQRTRERILHALVDVGRRLESLNAEVTALEVERSSLSEGVNKMRSSIADAGSELSQIHRSMGELRPVLARGAGMLVPDLAAVEQRVETVRANLAKVHSQSEAYGLVQGALEALQEDVSRLVSLKAQASGVREQRLSLEARLAPLQRRLGQLTAEQVSADEVNRTTKDETEQVEVSLEQATQRIMELTDRLNQAAAELDAMETKNKGALEQLEVQFDAAAKQSQELEAVVRSRQQWLEDFRVAETASTELENELTVLKGWSLAQTQ